MHYYGQQLNMSVCSQSATPCTWSVVCTRKPSTGYQTDDQNIINIFICTGKVKNANHFLVLVKTNLSKQNVQSTLTLRPRKWLLRNSFSASARRNVVSVRIKDSSAVLGLGIWSSNEHVTFVVSFANELFTADALTNCRSEELSTGMLSLSKQDSLSGTG